MQYIDGRGPPPKGRRVAALYSIRSALTMNIINISRASNHKAQLAAERGGAGKPTKCIT